MDKRNSMVVRLDMVMVVGPLPVTVMAVDSRKTRIFYSLAGRIMTQGNMIGNNQAQKINSVRSEIGLGDNENCGACALTRAGRVSSEREREREREKEREREYACVCACVWRWAGPPERASS